MRPASAGPNASGLIAPALLEGDKPVDAVVFFKPTAGAGLESATSRLDAAEQLPLGPERKRAAYESLRQIGTETLEQHMPLLDGLKRDGKVSAVDALWSMNAVRVRGASIDALKTIAGSGVYGIVPDEKLAAPTLAAPLEDAVHAATMVPQGKWQPHKASEPGVLPAGGDDVWMDWGVKKMNAPAAWQQGITGAGIVIGSLDTGVITDHPGLARNYRGTRPDGTQDHNYNLANFVETTATQPIDDVGHGTHTLGTAAGYSPNHLVGVAPDAKFVVARGLGNAGGSLFGLMSAMEWFMAPTDQKGANPRPELAPDIVTNSWGGGTTSNPFLFQALRNWRRAGIVPVFAAGNNRRANPGEVASPGLHSETITVGATERDDSRAFFSMYGPSDYSSDHKPEVTAPGTWTYSTYPDGTYRDTFVVDGKEYPASGTSMATPHVAGAMALYMQAHPKAKYDEILSALKGSGVLTNNPTREQGYGRVQVDKLIAPDSIDPKAKRATPARVKELMEQVAKAKVFKENDPLRQPPKLDENGIPIPPKKARKR